MHSVGGAITRQRLRRRRRSGAARRGDVRCAPPQLELLLLEGAPGAAPADEGPKALAGLT